ncbi:diacylglycerol kinase family protein [soil metagenome]
MRFHVLVNGGAGSVDDTDQTRQVADIEAAFVAVGAEAKVSVVPPANLPDEACRIWESERPDAVVVAGGDGTVNCVAEAAVETEVVLGVLPLGTFNHFAKDLGLASDLAGAVAGLVSGEVRQVDVGELNGRLFVNNSALGAYPAMVDIRDRIRDERGWGKARAVPVAAYRVLRDLPTHRLDLSGPDGYQRLRVRTPLVFVGNGVYDNSGGGLAARDNLADGVLGVAVARVVSRWGLVGTVLRALVFGVDRARDLDREELTELTVTSRARHIQVARDGEVDWVDLPLRYRSRPGALHVLAPPVPPA